MSNFKKFAAVGLALTMVLGCSMTSLAANGDEDAPVTAEGTGTAAFVDKDVYLITVPTQDAMNAALAFTTDPYDLAREVAAEGTVFEEGAKVLFASDKETTGYDYASTSKDVTITNKGAIGVTVAVEAVIKPGSATYAAGYSATPDFSGTGEATKGLYFGLLADNEVEKPLSTTAVTFTNAVLSAADQYEVKLSGTTYSYTLKSDAKDFPTFSFAVRGVLNTDAPETTWYSISDKTKTALTMPGLEVKFTPTGIREAKEAVIEVDGDDFYVSKVDEAGGFGDTKPASLYVNGKQITTISNNTEGYVTVKWADVYTAWGYTSETIKDLSEEEQGVIWNGVKSIYFTMGSGATAVKYYAERK